MTTYRGVPLPALLDHSKSTEAAWKIGVDAALAVALPLLESQTDTDACSLDHHGYCQEHWGGDALECPVKTSRAFLEAAALPQAVWRASIATDPYLYWCLECRPALAVVRVLLSGIHPSVTVQCVQCGTVAR